MKKHFLFGVAAWVIPSPVLAQSPREGDAPENGEIIVTARKLDAMRDSISSSIGANEYKLDRAALDVQPGGVDRSLKGVLLQAPGVTQDSDGDGDVHIRNEHGNIQYRLNGVVIPESFAGFGAIVDPRVADSIEILTGALPAQFGLRTAGVVSLKTRTDAFDLDGDIGVYGGGNGTFQPSATIRNSTDKLNYFGSVSYLRNNQGISNPTPSKKAIHDRTEQWRGFGYLSYILNDANRISLFGGSSIGKFQIPNASDVLPAFQLNGRSTFDSTKLDQNQKQKTHFGAASWEVDGDSFDVMVAGFVRAAKAHYTPDPSGGQLIFNGVDSDLTQSSFAWGFQGDGSIKLGDRHIARLGLFYQRDRTRTDSINRVFALTTTGVQASDTPLTIPVAQRANGTTFSAYLQDEWKLTDSLTFNFGARFDALNALVKEHQFSPRAGLVWKPTDATTLHLGYARYFTPPPLELIAGGTVAAFSGTTGEAPSSTADPVRAEREHSFDIGAQHVFNGKLSVGIDIYYKKKRNLLDEEHFGSTLIQSPFNYANAKGWGAEFSLNYETKAFESYLNVARGQQKARKIISNQFFFEPDELAYIADNYIFTDHSQKWTISGGGALTLKTGFGKIQPSWDFIFGDGLRAGDPAGVIPNGGKQKSYIQANAGIGFVIGGKEKEDRNWTFRIDAVNLFDKVYLIHDGSGVGAGQPEWGPRRAIFAGLRKGF